MVPDEYKEIIKNNLKYYYDDDNKLDVFNKNKLWQCNPKLKNINLYHYIMFTRDMNHKYNKYVNPLVCDYYI
jgi:DNA-binding transcriptional regulator/RsmH inhibitor MraZ